MKSKLAQLALIINKIDRQHIQFAYFLLALAGLFILQAPSDGGTGPY
jgi:hypothetical protein